jgi:hypothetical protein
MGEFLAQLVAAVVRAMAEIVGQAILLLPIQSQGRDSLEYQALRPRNAWISVIARVLAAVGFAAPFMLPGVQATPGWPVFGLACGLFVVVPNIWICLVTLPFGWQRYDEYWRFHQLHCDIGLVLLLSFTLPLVVVGVVSVIALARAGNWPLL